MFEMVISSIASSAKHNRNEVGIAKPTSSAARVPSEASTTIITSAMAVSTDPSSWLTMEATPVLWSFEMPTVIVARMSSVQLARSASTTSRTTAAVSMMLKPRRLTTCNATVVSPLNRAVLCRSSKVRLISDRSPSVTTRSPCVLTGRL